ncbi:MAG: ThuA domain-containing protein [Bryobacteraceae bacterium]
MSKSIYVLLSVALCGSMTLSAADQFLTFRGTNGPGKGKRIVLIAADQEYRSEESIPELARILAKDHGFDCTVLFAINKQTGEIDPSTVDNVPGLDALDSADLMVLFVRWLELPDDQMKHIIDYTNSGRPIVAFRTATHPFRYVKHLDSPYAKYSYDSKDPKGGYGRLVIGETWVAHYGEHEVESTRGVIAPGMASHPILRGVHSIWGASDVYALTSLTGDSKPLVLGQVLSGMQPASPPDPNKKLVPIAWVKTYTGESGRPDRVFATTMGHALDFKNEGFRRMAVNACYWALGMEKAISPTSNVALIGKYDPNPIGEGKQKTGLHPSDLK